MADSAYDLLVIGGGAAGFFGAIAVAETRPATRILIVEKTTQLLSKVKVSGGGRCNVTHASESPASLSAHYPRGARQLKRLFHRFQATDTVEWFRKHGVSLKTESDGRMFPDSDQSQTIIDCFLQCAHRLNIQIKKEVEIEKIETQGGSFRLLARGGGLFEARTILVATGGHPRSEAYAWLRTVGIPIVYPIPSLFTFNDSGKEFSSLMGVAVPEGEVRIAGTKFSQRGPVLITHWGLSGPAVIRLSAWAAEYLHENNYTFNALVNWTGLPEPEIRAALVSLKKTSSQRLAEQHVQFGLPSRLWVLLCTRSGATGRSWAELPDKAINRLTELLFASSFLIKGKTTFKEEFVTCGGVDLSEVDQDTMQSKTLPGLFFAGEVLHVDGETGGFNFQAAWTTAFVAARGAVIRLNLTV